MACSSTFVSLTGLALVADQLQCIAVSMEEMCALPIHCNWMQITICSYANNQITNMHLPQAQRCLQSLCCGNERAQPSAWLLHDQ